MVNFLLKTVKALVVDDDVAHRELAAIYFDELGCSADFAVDGQEAVDKVRIEKYNICFMDLQMPGLSGIEATKIIREEISKQIPIIVVTSPETEASKDDYVAVGFTDFLAKPITLEKIEGMLNKYALKVR